jgi:hypothetical protein
VAIAPGFTATVARTISRKWRQLGPDAVQVVVDPDPEVCRLGLGDMEALTLLHSTAAELGTTVHQQRGLRVGVVITDETTTIYAPVPRLIEAGGQPGERLNALRLDAPLFSAADSGANSVERLNLHTSPIGRGEVQYAAEELEMNPPVKFDLARRVRVFNARFEFVEFELHGLFLSRKRVQIPSDLLGLAKESRAQKLLHSSFQLIEDNSEVSGDRVTRLKQFIAKKYLINLPAYGTVILRNNKSGFREAVGTLEQYIQRFQRRLKRKLQETIEANREVLAAALLPSVMKSPPVRWQRYLGAHPRNQEVERMLRSELTQAFGHSEDLLQEMKVKVIFKGVTYESLVDTEFMQVATKKIPFLEELHEEFDAAKAVSQEWARKSRLERS